MTSRYQAYLSYSHTDERFAKWLHSGLEAYRVPKSLVSAGRPRRLSRVFRDRVELPSSASLGAALDEALARSDALIVVCSPAAAASQWVNEEISRYKLAGRGAHIYPIIIEGEPPDCFPPALRFELDANGRPSDIEAQPIAADARPHADGPRDARLKVIAALLGVGFDELKRRDLRRRYRQMALVAGVSLTLAAITLVLAAVAFNARSDAERRRDQAEHLISFIIGDLRGQLEPLGRLEILDTVGDQAMEFYATLESEDETDAVLTTRSTALRQIGEVRVAQGRLDEAHAAFTQSNELTKVLSERHPDQADLLFEVAQGHFWIGFVQLSQSRIDAARQSFEAYRRVALDLTEREPTNPDYRREVAYAASNLGTMAIDENDLEAARRHFQEAVDISRALLLEKPDDQGLQSDLGGSYSWLGELAHRDGDAEGAVAWYEQELDIFQALSSSSESMIYRHHLVMSLDLIAFAVHLVGDQERAAAFASRALKIANQLVAHDPENTEWQNTQSMAEMLFGRIQFAAGHPAVARSHLEVARDLLAKLHASDPVNAFWHRDYCQALLHESRVLLALGDVSSALRAADTGMRSIAELESMQDDKGGPWLQAALHVAFADALFASGEAQAAEREWQASARVLTTVSEDSKHPMVMLTRSLVLDRAGQLDAAADVRLRLNALGYAPEGLVPARLVQ